MYIIKAFSFDLLGYECRNKILGLMHGHAELVKDFCDIYFDRFFLLHKVGHIVLEMFDPEQSTFPARAEYLANLFALKYLEKKGEKDYIARLNQGIDLFLANHNASFEFNIQQMDSLFHRYKLDFLTYAVFHFNSYKKCITEKKSLEDVLFEISCGGLKEINNFTLLKKGAVGQLLVNECCQTIFELNTDVPLIKVEFTGNFCVDELDVLYEEMQSNI